MRNPPPAGAPIGNRQVDTIRGQYHRFALIPMLEIRALDDSVERMVRGPSIHVFGADNQDEYLRFYAFGKVLHYHYVHDADHHNTLWGYDPDTNGSMIPWVIEALRNRLPTMLRRAGETRLATDVEEQGWDTSVLPAVARGATDALAPRGDDLRRAKEGMDWMYRWKAVHPQFNTVGDGEY